MTLTLCIAPRDGELCAPVEFLFRHDSTVVELTARHRINDAYWDVEEDAVVISIEITDPETSRPVDVRIDLVPADGRKPWGRSSLIGHIDRNGEPIVVYGTYLGVVADEN